VEIRLLNGPFVFTAIPQERLLFWPHISATPRDQTDTEQHDSLKTINVGTQTDSTKQIEGLFHSQGVGIETRAAHQ